MLRDFQFYSINAFDELGSAFTTKVQLNSNNDIFKGHFPGNPITPGVAQLEIIKELLSQHFNKVVKLKSISNCKYLAILNPLKSNVVDFEISYNKTEDHLKVNAVIKDDQTVYTKVAAIYTY